MIKRGTSLLVVTALAALLVYLLATQTDLPVVEDRAVEDSSTDDRVTDDQPEPAIDERYIESLSQLDQPLPPADARAARVLRLADGDSFDIVWLDTDERDEVRMFGINAPEGGACFGNDARDVLQALTEDQDLLVEAIQRDEFGRVLGNVWVDDLFINATLVELGAALALSDGGRYADLITQSQGVARDTSAGLWDPSACGADPTANVRIDWIEANAPGRDDENKNGEWIVIENVGDIAADMTDWSIRDESTRHRFFFPDGHVIDAGGSSIIYSGCGTDNGDELFWCDDDPVWNNGGDTGFLVDPDGRFADSLSYSG